MSIIKLIIRNVRHCNSFEKSFLWKRILNKNSFKGSRVLTFKIFKALAPLMPEKKWERDMEKWRGERKKMSREQEKENDEEREKKNE